MISEEDKVLMLRALRDRPRHPADDLRAVISDTLTGQEYTTEDRQNGTLAIVTAEPLSHDQKGRILECVPAVYKMVFEVAGESK